MSRILLTGASGFIGSALAPALAEEHELLCIGRHEPSADVPFVRGLFASFEDLRRLDDHEFDVAVHLAGVTGGCSERDGMLVNVEGTRCLMRYLMDRGCRKFVMASSIAAVGMQSVEFRPRAMPLPDEHPCLDRDGYGFSKYMMEEVARYHARQNEELDVINLRLASILPDDARPEPARPGPVREWALGSVTLMYLSDCVRAFRLAVAAAHKPGVRVMNATSAHAHVAAPLPDVLRAWWPDLELDLSHYERSGHERDSAYDIRRAESELGFIPERSPLEESEE
jgi:UDP-glucose 4-epimerase